MSLVHHQTSSPELSGLVPTGGLVVAETSESRAPRYARARALAAELAHAAGARVMLVDVSPPEAAWARRGVVPDTIRRPLHAWELESLGRAYLLHQIGETASQSVHATAWLADRSGPSAIADAVNQTGAALVVLPADPDPAPDPFGRPVLRLTAAYHASKIAARVVTVDDAGTVRVVEPLITRRPGIAERAQDARRGVAADAVPGGTERPAETRAARAGRRLRAACETRRVIRSGAVGAAAGS